MLWNSFRWRTAQPRTVGIFLHMASGIYFQIIYAEQSQHIRNTKPETLFVKYSYKAIGWAKEEWRNVFRNGTRNFSLFHRVQRRLHGISLKYADGEHRPRFIKIKNFETLCILFRVISAIYLRLKYATSPHSFFRIWQNLLSYIHWLTF